MKVLILGSSGFIGQNLLKALPDTQGVSLRNPNWQQNLEGAEVLVNLVGKAHDHHNLASEKDYYDVNLELTKKIFQAFMDSDAKLLLHVSSLAAIEEFESNHPLIETDPCDPQSWYGKSKRAAEEWLLEQENASNKKMVILRPPMVHGPGDKGNLGLLYKLISKGVPYPLGSFNNKRSFISIDNFIFFIGEIIKNSNKLSSGIYHIADQESLSTKRIIEIMKEETGKNTISFSLPRNLVTLVAKIGDKIPLPLNSKRLKKMTGTLEISNRKICEELGLSLLPQTAEEGLRKTIRSFNK